MPTVSRPSNTNASHAASANSSPGSVVTLRSVSPNMLSFLRENSNNAVANVLLDLLTNNGQLSLLNINTLLSVSPETLAGEFNHLASRAPNLSEFRELITILMMAFMHQTSLRLLDLAEDGDATIKIYPPAYCIVNRITWRLFALMPHMDAVPWPATESDSVFGCPYSIPPPSERRRNN